MYARAGIVDRSRSALKLVGLKILTKSEPQAFFIVFLKALTLQAF